MKANKTRHTVKVATTPALTIAFLNLFLSTASTLPQVMTFQGVLKDSAGSLLTGTYNLTFRIYPSETGGSQLYYESQNIKATKGFEPTYREDIHKNYPEEVNER